MTFGSVRKPRRGQAEQRADDQDHQQQPELGAAAQPRPGRGRALRHRCAPPSRARRRRRAPTSPTMRPRAHVQHAVAGGEDLHHLVGDQDDADAVAGEFGDHLVDALLVLDVDADGGAVEDQHLRVGGEPFRQHHPLLVAAGEGLHRPVEAGDLDGEAVRPSRRRGRAGGSAASGRGGRSGASSPRG